MAIFTVIGFYEGEYQAFADHIEASDEFHAMGLIGAQHTEDDLVIVGAIPGAHQLLTPGDDNESIASAADMADLA